MARTVTASLCQWLLALLLAPVCWATLLSSCLAGHAQGSGGITYCSNETAVESFFAAEVDSMRNTASRAVDECASTPAPTGTGVFAGTDSVVKCQTSDVTSTDSEPHDNLATLEARLTTLEAQVADLHVQFAEDGAMIAEITAMLAERSAQLAEYNAQIAEFDAQIAEHGAQIAEHGAQIAEHGAQIAEHDAQIAELSAKIAENGAQIAENGAQLAELTRDTAKLWSMVKKI